MKPSLSRPVLIAALTLAAVGAEPPAPAVFVDPAGAEAAAVRAVAEKVIDRMAATLLAEVTAAVAAGGPERAIEVCHTKAAPLTAEAGAGTPRVLGVKRTSLRLRNPANAPDAFEAAALARAEGEAAAGQLSPVLVQRIDRAAGPEWRVYRPIRLAPACLACHGPADTLAPGVKARLAALYPADRATGYAEGQWRGLFRVALAAGAP